MTTDLLLDRNGSSLLATPGGNTAENLLRAVLDAIPDSFLLLDGDQRVLKTNGRFLQTFGLADDQVIGHRIGEVLGCLFADESPGGCGSGLHCSVCGAMKTLQRCRELKGQVVQECQIVLRGEEEGGALDLEVTASYSLIEGEPVIVYLLRDISQEKRRSVLERLFFHDLLNTVGGIHGLAQLLNSRGGHLPDQDSDYSRWLLDLSTRLIEEIQHQRKLVAAERGEFTPEPGLVEVGELLIELHALYSSHQVAEGKTLQLGNICTSHIISDRQVLRRILGNLVKNALEAVGKGETVTIECRDDDTHITFSVHNPGVIPADVQLQLFRRSFSTKGEAGRGIGTYSVKLFGERYLKGKVDFTSREPDGTTFTFALPKNSFGDASLS